MKITALVVIALVAYVLGFGILFGSHLGLMGDMVHWDLHAKTRILNTLAIFGYLALGGGAILAMRKTKDNLHWMTILGILVVIAVSYGFTFIDCAIFNFCSEG
jgi:hypothetical protein